MSDPYASVLTAILASVVGAAWITIGWTVFSLPPGRSARGRRRAR